MKTMTRRQFGVTLGQAAIAGRAMGWAEEFSAEAAGTQPVYVVLWFDTEDYILPASDDAAMRLAEFLTKLGLKANFKVVGEKARVLEARGRRDLVEALKKHEIGYHSNTHSQQPTIAVYESALDWQQGVAEFDRRERGGFDDVARVFGKAPTCFGQPGTSWAPQSYPALKKWGVGVYLDDGKQVGLNGKPFWYGGLLNIFNIDAGRGMEQNEDWSNLEAAKADFKRLHQQFSTTPGGGLVSFMFHPTQFVSERFWDAVNFTDGANPPRAEWKEQPRLTAAQTAAAFRYLEDLVKYVAAQPNVRFVTATEALELYKDTAQGRNYAPKEIAEIASKVSMQIDMQTCADYALAAGEVLALLNEFVANGGEGVTLRGTPYGPSAAAPARDGGEVSWDQFARTAKDVQGALQREGQIPIVVWLGSTAVTPEAYLRSLAGVAEGMAKKQPNPATVKIGPAELAAARWVAKDSEEIWQWPIFPPRFHSAHLMELSRLQAWTLKPALLMGA